MFYTTLKDNLANGNDYTDIAYYVDENWQLVADLFPNSEKYYWNNNTDHTDFDILYKDYTKRQVASACLKYLKKLCKGKKPSLMIWHKMFIDLDCDGEIAFEQLKQLIEDDIITNSNQLKEIDKKAKKKGCKIRTDFYCYDEENYFCRRDDIDDLIDKFFPCKEKLVTDEDGDEYYECIKCGNCG